MINVSGGTYEGNVDLAPTGAAGSTINYGPETGTRTIKGNVYIDGDSQGTINLRNLNITGNLVVNTPGATVNNGATVGGAINIVDVATGTWNEQVNGNSIVVNDTTGITLNVAADKTVASLLINKPTTLTVGAGAKFDAPVQVKAATTIISADEVSAVIAQDVVVKVKPSKDSEVVTEVTGNGSKVNVKEEAVKEEANKLETATTAVVKAEGSKLSADVDAAQKLVTALVDGDDKVALQLRINVLVDSAAAARNLATAKSDAAKFVGSNYTTASFAALTSALAGAETTTVEMNTKTAAINDAIAGLVKQGEGTTKLQLESGKNLIFKVYGIKSGNAEAKLTKDQLVNAFVNANLDDLKAIAQLQKDGLGGEKVADVNTQAAALQKVLIKAENISYDNATGVLSIPSNYTEIFSAEDFDVVKTTDTDYNISVFYEGATTSADRLAKITINKANGVKFTEVK